MVYTLILARDKFHGSAVNLDVLCKRYRVDNSKRTNHTALIDCDLLAKVYINLIDQKEPTLDFQRNNTEKSEINFSEPLSSSFLIAALAVLVPDLVCNIHYLLFSTVNSMSCISLYFFSSW